MAKSILITLGFLVGCISINAQKVKFELSSFPNKHYSLVLYYGNNGSVVNEGKFDNKGTMFSSVPNKTSPYTGFASLRIENGEKIDFFLNGRDFYFSSDSPKPYYDLSSDTSSYSIKYYELEKTFERVSNYSSLNDLEIKKIRENTMKKIDLISLYYSPLWQPLFLNWAMMEHERVKDDITFVEDARSIMVNAKPSILLDCFANTLIDICENEGWNEVKNESVALIYESGALHNPTGKLKSLMKPLGAQLGDYAPNIQINEKKSLKDYSNLEVILFFYESGCHHCMAQEKILIPKYEELKKNKYKIISISSDFVPEIFKETANTFPWEDKVFDPESSYFIKYGVTKTPTYFLIGKNGKIRRRFSKIDRLVL